MDESNKNNSGMSVASLTLGIVSIVFALFWYLTLPTGILAIVFGHKAAKRNGSKIGKSGLILGIIGLSLFVFIYISMIIALLTL